MPQYSLPTVDRLGEEPRRPFGLLGRCHLGKELANADVGQSAAPLGPPGPAAFERPEHRLALLCQCVALPTVVAERRLRCRGIARREQSPILGL